MNSLRTQVANDGDVLLGESIKTRAAALLILLTYSFSPEWRPSGGFCWSALFVRQASRLVKMAELCHLVYPKPVCVHRVFMLSVASIP